MIFYKTLCPKDENAIKFRKKMTEQRLIFEKLVYSKPFLTMNIIYDKEA